MNWIPVSEKLPGTSKRVLVCDRYGNMEVADYNVLNDHFTGWISKCILDSAVIAWMPLPKPYKEVQNG